MTSNHSAFSRKELSFSRNICILKLTGICRVSRNVDKTVIENYRKFSLQRICSLVRSTVTNLIVLTQYMSEIVDKRTGGCLKRIFRRISTRLGIEYYDTNGEILDFQSL